MAFVFIGTILIFFEEFPVPADIGLFIAGWLVYSLFCFSLCLLFFVVLGLLPLVKEAFEEVHLGRLRLIDLILRSILGKFPFPVLSNTTKIVILDARKFFLAPDVQVAFELGPFLIFPGL